MQQALRRPAVAILIALLLGILVFAACYFLLIGPKKGAVSKKQKEVEAAQQKLETEKTTYRELLNIKNRSAEYESRLAFLQSIIPQEAGLPSLIRSIQAAADPGTGAGLPWLGFTPSEISAAEGGGGYSSYTFTMKVGGFYDQVVDLIYRMERFPRAVVITGVNMTLSTGFLQSNWIKEFGAAKDFGVVNCDITAKTFTFATAPGAAAATPGSTPAPQSTPSTSGG
jgi:Tfp pilus assembly protein PilO